MLKLEKEAEEIGTRFETLDDLKKVIIFTLLWKLWSVLTFLPAAQKDVAEPRFSNREKATCKAAKSCSDF